MHRFVGFVALWVLLLPTSHAEPIPGLDRYLAAVDKFIELREAATARRTMPRVTDVGAEEMFKILSDERVLTQRPFTQEDGSAVWKLCIGAGHVSNSYVLFTPEGALADADTPPSDSDFLERAAVNSFDFQDELALLRPLTIRCLGVLMPLMHRLVMSIGVATPSDDLRQSLLDARRRAMGEYLGGLIVLSDRRMKTANQQRILSALADTSSSIAEALPAPDRRSISGMANVAARGAPTTFLKPLKEIQDAMREARCSALCGL